MKKYCSYLTSEAVDVIVTRS